MLWTTLLMAFSQLRRNTVRTALTSLGILIGVAAVISMVAIGRGATRAVEDDLSDLGDRLLFVVPESPGHRGPPGPSKPFSEADVQAIRDQVKGLDAVAPMGSASAIAAYGEQSWRTTVQGSSTDFLRTMSGTMASGRLFEPGEELSGADVCVLGETVVAELFGGQNPLEQQVRVSTMTCRVIGVVAARGQNTFGQDQDDFVLVPLRTFQRRIQGSRDIGIIFVSAAEGEQTERVKEDLEKLMLQRRFIRPGAEPDFVVRDMAEVASMLQSISAVLTGFLAAIAGVSLLVGGIGIMNIMMVSVTERTREIGIRLAIGALAGDVLLQFLVESMVLAAVGGSAGIAFGVLVSWGASAALSIPLVVEPLVILGAFVFSALIGVVFGYFPARHAARMNPIDALRHE